MASHNTEGDIFGGNDPAGVTEASHRRNEDGAEGSFAVIDHSQGVPAAPAIQGAGGRDDSQRSSTPPLIVPPGTTIAGDYDVVTTEQQALEELVREETIRHLNAAWNAQRRLARACIPTAKIHENNRSIATNQEAKQS